jgi:uncharacterized Tic20 family protein
MNMDAYDKPKRGIGTETTQDDRIMAALSHIAIVIGLAIILPGIIWFVYRDKSPYVRFQALQAAVWQLITTVGGMLVAGCAFMALMMTGMMADSSNSGGFVCLPFPVICGVILVSIAFTIYGLYAAIVTFGGSDFRYPVIGSWLENR